MLTAKSIFILGRQPALGIAELESLYEPNNLEPAGEKVLLSNIDASSVDFERLGGSVKLAKILFEIEATSWSGIHNFLTKRSADLPFGNNASKSRLGISAVGIDTNPRALIELGLTIKRLLKKTGRSIRVVPNTAMELNSAQVIHNKLTGMGGLELVLVRHGNKTIIAQTVAEQNITLYSQRDFYRPKIDLKVGLLPPKLAQILINLAAGTTSRAPKLILDPFCGSGVLVQEALLMGYTAIGSDIAPKMIKACEENLNWLTKTRRLDNSRYELLVADATKYQWKQPVDFVACETYLGEHLSESSTGELLAGTIAECTRIISGFLRNIRPQLTSGTRLCLAVPAWYISPNKFKHLPFIDQIEDLGYIRVSFECVSTAELVYFRTGQSVARELLVLSKI